LQGDSGSGHREGSARVRGAYITNTKHLQREITTSPTACSGSGRHVVPHVGRYQWYPLGNQRFFPLFLLTKGRPGVSRKFSCLGAMKMMSRVHTIVTNDYNIKHCSKYCTRGVILIDRKVVYQNHP